ncbi:cytochrome P450 2K6-like [Carcharodon carcharias]|uniref:cytochrome P450 2K6-like n=1 Tax=Carcharodon carcharias TaxID=13397 RepID=UPI001B7EADA2|nr:cytochrome P450 2K6-like [Carcharodon carcharias]
MNMLKICLLDPTSMFLLITLLFLVIFYIKGSNKRSSFKVPPSPTPLPLIGNLHQLGMGNLHRSLMRLAEKYGNLYNIRFGYQKLTILTGYGATKDALIDQANTFIERFVTPINEAGSEKLGIIFSEGELWRQMRRFTLTTLRDFGMGKKSIEEKIIEEVGFLVNVFKSYNVLLVQEFLTLVTQQLLDLLVVLVKPVLIFPGGETKSILAGQPIQPQNTLDTATANIIAVLLFQQRFDYEDESLRRFLTILHQIQKDKSSPMVEMINALPFLKFLPGRHKRVMDQTKELMAFLIPTIAKIRKQLNENDVTNYTEAFLVKQKEEAGNPDSFFHDKSMFRLITELFAAGTETTSTTLRWGLLLMMKYPEIQKRVQEEIDREIGTERPPRMEDQQRLPYTKAVIYEIMRFASVITMITRENIADTHLRGYFIPKRSHIIIVLLSVLRDKTYWEKPDEFNPSHFLNSEGRLVKREAFLPFGAGSRVCAGQSLAKMELFLFFTTMLQKLKFQAPADVTDLDLTPIHGQICFPKPYKLCAISRE